MSFSEEEIAYLRSQRLARVSTVSPDGQPDVVPVGFEFDGTYVYVGGIDPVKTRKFRNVQAGNAKVALVVDDLVSANPWTPRYLRIYGTAELVERQGQFGAAAYMRITPAISWSFNLAGRSPTTARSASRAPSTRPRPGRARNRFTQTARVRRGLMSFDTRPGTRGARQPSGRFALWFNKLAARRIRRKGGRIMGFDALLLTTTGRKSGLERTSPVGWFPGQDGRPAIGASAAGAPGNPAWYYNIAAHPEPGRDRGRRPRPARNRRTAPRDRTRTGMGADHRRRTPVRSVPGQDRPGTADHPPGTPAASSRMTTTSPAGTFTSRPPLGVRVRGTVVDEGDEPPRAVGTAHDLQVGLVPGGEPGGAADRREQSCGGGRVGARGYVPGLAGAELVPGYGGTARRPGRPRTARPAWRRLGARPRSSCQPSPRRLPPRRAGLARPRAGDATPPR